MTSKIHRISLSLTNVRTSQVFFGPGPIKNLPSWELTNISLFQNIFVSMIFLFPRWYKLHSQEILFISFHFIHHHLVGFFLPESLCQLDLIAIDLWQLGAVAFYALTGSHPCETRTLVFCSVVPVVCNGLDTQKLPGINGLYKSQVLHV